MTFSMIQLEEFASCQYLQLLFAIGHEVQCEGILRRIKHDGFQSIPIKPKRIATAKA